MSIHTDRSAWSPEEGDSLENVDKEIQLVSTSSESHTVSNVTKENEPVSGEKLVSCSEDGDAVKASNSDCLVNGTKSFNNLQKISSKLCSSFDDLCLRSNDNCTDDKFMRINDQDLKRSPTLPNLKRNKKFVNKKYNHVQSKVKQYFDCNTEVTLEKNVKKSVVAEHKGDRKKEDYLEEINKQLAKELDEKNAILTLLQENYEHLLFKYAEAQNRIDELRFKCMSENKDFKEPCHHYYYNKIDNKTRVKYPPNDSSVNRIPTDAKCQRVTGTNDLVSLKEEQSFHLNGCNSLKAPVPRPLSLPLDTNLKFVERDAIMTKATTPTDSEGLSSIITSMSGHSKILNSLDEENQINKKPNLLKTSNAKFILEGNSPVNDPFDKVKNWQNSLPPLEQIETPETALYNVYNIPNNSELYSSGETKYNTIASPKIENEYEFLDESCPASWRDENMEEDNSNKCTIRRTVSLPNSKRNLKEQSHNKKAHYSSDTSSVIPEKGRSQNNCLSERIKTNQGSKNNQSRRKVPISRCSSLPTYKQNSSRSGSKKNGIYIPPLDLGNVTLSDDECYCQQDYCTNKSSASSFATSGRGSNDRFVQTPQSYSPHKATISEDEPFDAGVRVHMADKSTSITPEMSKPMDYTTNSSRSKPLKVDKSWQDTFPPKKTEYVDCRRDRAHNWCNICGESITDGKTSSDHFLRNRSNSYESVHGNDSTTQESTRRRPKPPFKRSISFGSEAITPKYCSHEDRVSKGHFLPIPSQESLENFDLYASSLKTRSQIVMKALTAHINNS
ncbi:hypothetical protein RUM44_009840 [Polyplax serrata]|uniref:Uncharacterized protein n=1 Tax=Polyplax serrata TaxID=468196 RepID=A0ABR1AU48_POLSC